MCASMSAAASSSVGQRCGMAARSSSSADRCSSRGAGNAGPQLANVAVSCAPRSLWTAALSMRGPSKQLLSIYPPVRGGTRTGTWLAAAAGAVRLPNVMTAGALLLAYVGLEWVSFIHEYKGVPVTPWNPGLGVAFALLVLKGAGYGLVLFVGVVIAEILVLRTELAWPVICRHGRHRLGELRDGGCRRATIPAPRCRPSHVRDVLRPAGRRARAAAAASAALLSVLLLAADELTIGDLPKSSVPLLVGDVIGIAVVTPLLLAPFPALARLARRSPWLRSSPRDAVSAGNRLHLVAGRGRQRVPTTTSCSLLLFLPVAGGRAAARHRRLVLRRSPQPSSASSPCCINTDMTRALFTEFQLVMLVLTMSGLLVGVVVSERQRADLAAREAEARLKEMQARGRAGRAHEPRERHGVRPGARDQSADDGGPRARALSPANPARARGRYCSAPTPI